MSTIADLPYESAARFGAEPALQYRAGDGWEQQSFDELAAVVQDVALGLAASGIEPGDRVCILAETTPAWTRAGLAVLAAGAVVVPIYATSSPEECAWVIADSGARLVLCAPDAQPRLPADCKALALEPGLESLAQLGRAEGEAAELESRRKAVRPEDTALIIYTSGTTGRAKGCQLTHRNWLRVCELTVELNYIRHGDVVYLFLPLAHVFAQMTQFASLAVGATLVFWGGDVARIVPELAEVRPTFLPSVPRIFEKVHAMLNAAPISEEERRARARALFGGRLRQALSGAAPIAQEVVEFFHAAGVPVLEGYGLTETTGIGTVNTITSYRTGSVGLPTPSVELRLASDGEIEMRGPHVFAGYWNNPAATAEVLQDGWFRTGDLGTIDADGFVRITGRKKDIIVTSGGKNISPANLENDLRQSPWISHAIVYGDRRPYPVALITLDPDTVPAWAAAKGVPVSSPEVEALIAGVVDSVNCRYSRASQIKRFAILPADLTVEAGELTPSLKIKRRVVADNHAAVIESLYT
jgi:long-chain acyl-CoA synthetase